MSELMTFRDREENERRCGLLRSALHLPHQKIEFVGRTGLSTTLPGKLDEETRLAVLQLGATVSHHAKFNTTTIVLPQHHFNDGVIVFQVLLLLALLAVAAVGLQYIYIWGWHHSR
jgi:hypothetical protein